MSYLEAVSIMGIRSFGPDKPQVIQFHSPVTLIVGQNGSGKTTIIECLRYVTTGELPVSTIMTTRHANFAHDLNIHNLDTLKAQVKLKFYDVSGQPVVAIRAMESKRKKPSKKIECKTLDSTIQKQDKRRDQAMTLITKCLDMNREMSTMLGVTDALLNYVIFCHQDDSNWPLSEPKILKNRFDEIFNATKYMKALESIKTTQKGLKDNINVYKSDLVYLVKFKEQAQMRRQEIIEAETQLKKYSDDVARMQAEIAPIKTRLDEIGRHRAEVDRLRSQIAGLKSEKEATEKNIRELRANIKEFYAGSIDDLHQEIDRFELDQKRILADLKEGKAELEDLINKESQLNKRKSDFLITKGKLETEIQNNNHQIERRDNAIAEYASKLDISGFSAAPLSDSKVSAFMVIMQQQIRELNEEMTKAKVDLDERVRKAKLEFEQASNNVAANDQTISLKDVAITRTEKDIEATKAFLSDMDHRQAKLDALGREIEILDEQLTMAESQIDEKILKEEISKLQLERNSADAKLRMLQEDLKTANRESSIRVELDITQKAKSAKDDELRRFLDKHRESLNDIFGGIPSLDNLRDTVEDDLTQRTKDRDDAVQKLNDAKATLQSKEKERDIRNNELKAKEQELRGMEERVLKICSGDDIKDELENIRESLEKLQVDKGTIDGTEFMNKSYVKKLENRPCCPLCERNFEDKNDATKLIDKLKREVKSLPDRASSLRQKIDEQQARQAELMRLQPVVEQLQNLKSVEIPSLRKLVDELNVEIRNIRKDITAIDNAVMVQDDDVRRVKLIQNDVGQIDALLREIGDLDQRLVAQKEKLSNSQTVRTVNDIEGEMSSVQVVMDDINESLTLKNDSLASHRDKLQHLRQRINDLTKEKLEITDASQKRVAYQEKLATLTAQRDQYRRELEELRLKVPELKRKLEESRINERQLEMRKDESMRDYQKRLQTLENNERTVKDFNESIQKFQRSGKQRQFEECVQKIQAADNEFADMSGRRQYISRKNEDLERSSTQSEIRRRELEDCLKVKQKEQYVDGLQSKILKSEANYERLGGVDVSEYDTVLANYSRLERELQKIAGLKIGVEEKIAEKTAELGKDDYKNADQKYVNKMIQLTTSEIAVTDLEKYYKALDQAIIEYHSSQMGQINEVLRSLWERIYKHDDIDYIAVRSESESLDKRRAYNYRVVMNKSGVELDMRGRCSAGQRVLACILIRIALADVFCKDCGILTLDEPTTNLDSENVQGLAEALVELIHERSVQKSFQLVIITHDENFVRMLLQGHPMEKHYRVTKDENGFTQVTERFSDDLD